MYAPPQLVQFRSGRVRPPGAFSDTLVSSKTDCLLAEAGRLSHRSRAAVQSDEAVRCRAFGLALSVARLSAERYRTVSTELGSIQLPVVQPISTRLLGLCAKPLLQEIYIENYGR
jgi:hypothetical protein